MGNPRVAVIIVNWNGLQDTLQCIASLLQVEYDPFEILVVDNHSSDGSVVSIQRQYPGIPIIETGENLGYTGGNNAGIQYALNRQADYFFLINNDTCVDVRILQELVDFAEAHPQAAIVGPKQYLYDQPAVIASMGGMVDWKGASIIHTSFGHTENLHQPPADKPRRVDFQDGCAVCIRRGFIEKAGLLDERYHLGGYEDADLGRRAARLGYEVWNVPAARMWHKVSAAAGAASPLTTYYMTRNALLFFSEHSPPGTRWLAVLRILARTIRTIGAWTLKPQYQNPVFRRKSKANQYAMRDFFLKRYGRMGPDAARYC